MSGAASSAQHYSFQHVVVHVQYVQGHGLGQAQAPLMQHSAQAKPTRHQSRELFFFFGVYYKGYHALPQEQRTVTYKIYESHHLEVKLFFISVINLIFYIK